MEQKTGTEITGIKEEVIFNQIITDDEQIEELVQLLRRLGLQKHKRVKVVVKVGHKSAP